MAFSKIRFEQFVTYFRYIDFFLSIHERFFILPCSRGKSSSGSSAWKIANLISWLRFLCQVIHQRSLRNHDELMKKLKRAGFEWWPRGKKRERNSRMDRDLITARLFVGAHSMQINFYWFSPILLCQLLCVRRRKSLSRDLNLRLFVFHNSRAWVVDSLMQLQLFWCCNFSFYLL